MAPSPKLTLQETTSTTEKKILNTLNVNFQIKAEDMGFLLNFQKELIDFLDSHRNLIGYFRTDLNNPKDSS